MTDIEQLVRESLTRGADGAPHVAGLAENAKSAVRRQRRQRAAALGAALGVASLVTVVSLAGSGGQPTVPADTASPAPSTSEPPNEPDTERANALPAALIGTWEPTMIAGFEQLDAAPDKPLLTFHADGTWTGSDGCNFLSGTYSAATGGDFSATVGPQTLRGCLISVPISDVVGSATSVLVQENALSLYNSRMRELGRFGWRAGGQEAPNWPEVSIPADARILVPPTNGVGTVRLRVRSQAVKGKNYRRFDVLVMCVGGGSYTVTTSGDTPATRHSNPCNGVPLEGAVVTEQTMHEVVVSATKGRFQVAVVGESPGIAIDECSPPQSVTCRGRG